MEGETGAANRERLAYWYFRLNGFLTIEDFQVHDDRNSNPRTDADLLAVRFKHRAENRERPMADDPAISRCNTFANVVIAEIKRGKCSLNGPWTDPASGNMERVLSSIGCISPVKVKSAAGPIYRSGVWADKNQTVRIFAIGNYRDADLPIPLKQQLTWEEIIDFCIRRFQTYERQKRAVRQWAEDGLVLRDLCVRGNKDRIRDYFDLPSANS